MNWTSFAPKSSINQSLSHQKPKEEPKTAGTGPAPGAGATTGGPATGGGASTGTATGDAKQDQTNDAKPKGDQ